MFSDISTFKDMYFMFLMKKNPVILPFNVKKDMS